MSELEVRLHPEAVAKAREARLWYKEHNPDVAEDFMRELRRSMNAVVEAPSRWPALWADFRRCLLRRFPYMIVYRVRGVVLDVIAIAHVSRRPGYWKTRT